MFNMVEAAGVESNRLFRDFALHCINIDELSCHKFPLTNQNESKRAFSVRNCQEFIEAGTLNPSRRTRHCFSEPLL
jgi:hypothetical protein